MNLHEYQGKEILNSFGVNIQRGIVASNVKDAVIAAMEKAESKAGQINTKGQELCDKFTYAKTVDSVLDCIYSS